MNRLFFIFSLVFLSINIYADIADDLIELKNIGLDDDSIAASAAQSKEKLSPKSILKLKKSGFSNELIKKILINPKEKKTQQPQTIIINQEKKTGQVELKVFSHAGGGKIFLDSSLLGKITDGINKFNVPTGRHTLKITYLDKTYEKEVDIDSSKANTQYIYYLDDLNDKSKSIVDKFNKKKIKELALFRVNQFIENITDSDYVPIGRKYFEEVKSQATKTIKIFDQEYTRIVFTGKKIVYYNSSEKAYADNAPTILFYIDIDEKLNTVNAYVNHTKAKRTYDQIIREYEEMYQNLSVIKEYNTKKNEPNIKVVYSKKAKKDTVGFHLKLPLSQSIYDLNNNNQINSVCPLESEYVYVWDRKRVDPSEKLKVPKGKKVVIAVHSNFLGNQTKIHYVKEDTDLKNVTFDNVVSFK